MGGYRHEWMDKQEGKGKAGDEFPRGHVILVQGASCHQLFNPMRWRKLKLAWKRALPQGGASPGLLSLG